MRKKEASFWSDIKALDERLAKDPESYCFARLSEVYLKVGLVSDALHTARKGVAKHPGYLAGQRALAMACHASGLHEESLKHLENVTAAMPEDVDALKILAHLYAEKSDDVAAIRAYRTLLEFKPEDPDSKTQLEALLAGGETASRDYADDDLDSSDFRAPLDQEEDEFDEDEIHELNESDIVYDEQSEPELATPQVGVKSPASDHHDPLSTVTLAELYVQQGFVSKALDIYRAILADDPANAQIRAKIQALEDREVSPEVQSEQELASTSDSYDYEPDNVEPAVAFEEPAAAFEEPAAAFEEPAVAFEEPDAAFEEPSDVAEPIEHISASDFAPEFSETPAPFEFQEEPKAQISTVSESAPVFAEPAPFAPLQNQSADNVVHTLDSWLENIRRIKACR